MSLGEPADTSDSAPQPMESGPSPASTKPPGWLDQGLRKGYEKSLKTVATAASALVDARAGAGTGGFLMRPTEAQDIAEPASRLLARHTPNVATGKVTDVSDVVELIVATFGYLMASISRRAASLAGIESLNRAAYPENPPESGIRNPDEPRDNVPAPMPAWPSPPPPPLIGQGA